MKRLMSDVWDGLRFQPGRTGLSVLAVCVGMTALTILLSVMGGLRSKSRALIKELGANVFVIADAKNGSASPRPLNIELLNMLRSSLSDCKVAGGRRFRIPRLDAEGTITVNAVDETFFAMRRWEIQKGRVPDRADISSANRVALVSADLSDKANWQLGSIIHLNGTPFTVVGITTTSGPTPHNDSTGEAFMPGEASVFVPLPCSSAWLSDNQIKGRHLDLIQVQVKDVSSLERAVGAAKRIVGDRDGQNSYTWITPQSVVKSVRRLQRIIALTAGSVALLCLILGGTTLMSLMVANVRDRVPEIALRRALGATSRDIAALFLSEACIVTIVSSLAGIAAAEALLWLARSYFPVPISLGVATVTVPLFSAALLGMLFSYLPARMAMQITPAEALRND